MSSQSGPPASGGSQLSTLLLRGFLRLAPSEQHRMFLLTIVIGGVCGLLAVLFHSAIRFVEHHLIDRALAATGARFVIWTLLTPTLGALVCGLWLQLAPHARGSGIPQVKLVYAVKSGRIRLRDSVSKFFIAALQIGSGSSLGREGPTVHICVGIASALGRLFAISPHKLRQLVPVGSAAGIAAAFNAPLAAVTFTIEEIVGDLDQTLLSGVVVAAALAAVIERSILGEHPVFDVPRGYALDHASSLVLYALLGVVAALVSHAFYALLLGLRERFKTLHRVPEWGRPALGGLATGALAVACLSGLHASGVTGGGYAALSDALSGTLTIQVMLGLALAKCLATAFSYSSGGAGGIFAPTLFIGGMLGGSFGQLDRWLLGHPDTQLGAFALVGMGAYFAAVIRAPITSFLIIFEMTSGYALILPLMIANSTAFMLARRLRPTPIYEALLEQDGLPLPSAPRTAAALSSYSVASAMTSQLVELRAELPVSEALALIAPHNFSVYPVVDAERCLVGLVSEARLRRSLAEGHPALSIADLARPEEYLRDTDQLVDAVARMNRLGARQMAVLKHGTSATLAGMLAMSDVMRAYARAAETSQIQSQPPTAILSPALHLARRESETHASEASSADPKRG